MDRRTFFGATAALVLTGPPKPTLITTWPGEGVTFTSMEYRKVTVKWSCASTDITRFLSTPANG